jgi:hypothetical protein
MISGSMSPLHAVFLVGGWRVAAITSNSLGQVTKGGPPAWGLGRGLTNPQHKNQHIMKCYTGPWTDSLEWHRQW